MKVYVLVDYCWGEYDFETPLLKVFATREAARKALQEHKSIKEYYDSVNRDDEDSFEYTRNYWEQWYGMLITEETVLD